MKRDLKKVDQFFASNLEGMRTEPSDQVWQGIEKRYFRRKAGYFTSFMKILPIIVLIGSGIAVYTIFFQPDMDTPIVEDKAVSVPAEALKAHENVQAEANTDDLVSPDILEILEVHTSSQQITEVQAPASEIIEKTGSGSVGVLQTEQSPVNSSIQSGIYRQAPLTCYQIPGYHMSTSSEMNTTERMMNDVAYGFNLNNDYVRKAEYWYGAQVTPCVVFYPGKNNKNSWTGELTVDYVPSRFTFQAGIGLGYYKESGSYSVAYSSFDSVGYYYDVTSFSVHPQNSDSVLFELTEANIYDSVDHIVLTEMQNKYLYLRFPVNIGYNVFNSKRFTCYVRGGVVFSVMLWKDEPEIRMPANDVSLIQVQQDYPGRVTSSWEFTAGISFIYKINKRLGLSFEPVYTRYISNIYKAGFDYSNTKPYAIGLRTGIYVKF